jgi:hypothetical protein
MSQCYIPSLYVVHFKGALNSGEAVPLAGLQPDKIANIKRGAEVFR